jgi:hypothetical protein
LVERDRTRTKLLFIATALLTFLSPVIIPSILKYFDPEVEIFGPLPILSIIALLLLIIAKLNHNLKKLSKLKRASQTVIIIFMLVLSLVSAPISPVGVCDEEPEPPVGDHDDWFPPIYNYTEEQKREFLCYPEGPIDIPENAIIYEDGSIYIPPDNQSFSLCGAGNKVIVYTCVLIDEEFMTYYWTDHPCAPLTEIFAWAENFSAIDSPFSSDRHALSVHPAKTELIIMLSQTEIMLWFVALAFFVTIVLAAQLIFEIYKWKKGREASPGQLSISELKELYYKLGKNSGRKEK